MLHFLFDEYQFFQSYYLACELAMPAQARVSWLSTYFHLQSIVSGERRGLANARPAKTCLLRVDQVP